jgi:nucleoid DNA-binding protein
VKKRGKGRAKRQESWINRKHLRAFLSKEFLEYTFDDINTILNIFFQDFVKTLDDNKKIEAYQFGVFMKRKSIEKIVEKNSITARTLNRPEGFVIKSKSFIVFRESTTLKKLLKTIKLNEEIKTPLIIQYPPETAYSHFFSKIFYHRIRQENKFAKILYETAKAICNCIFYVLHQAVLNLKNIQLKGIGKFTIGYRKASKKFCWKGTSKEKVIEGFFSKPRYFVRFTSSQVVFSKLIDESGITVSKN